MEGLRRGGRIGGRNEGAGLKRLVDEGSEIPDTKLTRDLERGQGLSMITAKGMRRFVADDPHLVKEIGDPGRNHALEFETAKQIRLLFVWACEQACFRSRHLREQFPELPKLDERGAGIVTKIPFRQRTEAHELHVMLGKESEVRTRDRSITHIYTSPAPRRKCSCMVHKAHRSGTMPIREIRQLSYTT